MVFSRSIEQRWSITVDNRFSTAHCPHTVRQPPTQRRPPTSRWSWSWRHSNARQQSTHLHHVRPPTATMPLWRLGRIPCSNLAVQLGTVAAAVAGDGPWTYSLTLLTKPYNNGPNRDSNKSRDLCFKSQEWDFTGINIPATEWSNNVRQMAAVISRLQGRAKMRTIPQSTLAPLQCNTTATIFELRIKFE